MEAGMAKLFASPLMILAIDSTDEIQRNVIAAQWGA
jgi:hypothetical protein